MKRLIGGAVFAALTLTARCEDFALALHAGRGPHVAARNTSTRSSTDTPAWWTKTISSFHSFTATEKLRRRGRWFSS
jgi:hypothetical protein